MPFLSPLPLTLGLLQDDAAGPAATPNMWFVMLGVLAIFWLVAILPERKARKKKQEMLDAMKKNDKVVTTGGMYATIAAVGEQDVTIKFDDGPTRVRVLKSAIASVLDGSEKPAKA